MQVTFLQQWHSVMHPNPSWIQWTPLLVLRSAFCYRSRSHWEILTSGSGPCTLLFLRGPLCLLQPLLNQSTIQSTYCWEDSFENQACTLKRHSIHLHHFTAIEPRPMFHLQQGQLSCNIVPRTLPINYDNHLHYFSRTSSCYHSIYLIIDYISLFKVLLLPVCSLDSVSALIDYSRSWLWD